MSMMLMAKAFGLKVGSAPAKLVLLKLADNASDEGKCWPSYQHIADQCEMSKRTAMRYVDQLCAKGYVKKVHRDGPKGNTSNMYYLTLDDAQKCLPSDTQSPPSDTESLPPSDTLSPRTSHSFEAVKEPYCANALREAFERYWKNVSNKKDKARAERYFNREAKKHGDPIAFADMLIKDMRQREASAQIGFDKLMPSTYLNNRRWEDDLDEVCPHSEIVALWAEIMPDAVSKPDPDDWTPDSNGFQALQHAWQRFKTTNRQSTGKPVFTEREQGLQFYRAVFAKLAKTHKASRDDAAQFCTLSWAVQQANTVAIFKGEVE